MRRLSSQESNDIIQSITELEQSLADPFQSLSSFKDHVGQLVQSVAQSLGHPTSSTYWKHSFLRAGQGLDLNVRDGHISEDLVRRVKDLHASVSQGRGYGEALNRVRARAPQPSTALRHPSATPAQWHDGRSSVPQAGLVPLGNQSEDFAQMVARRTAHSTTPGSQVTTPYCDRTMNRPGRVSQTHALAGPGPSSIGAREQRERPLADGPRVELALAEATSGSDTDERSVSSSDSEAPDIALMSGEQVLKAFLEFQDGEELGYFLWGSTKAAVYYDEGDVSLGAFARLFNEEEALGHVKPKFLSITMQGVEGMPDDRIYINKSNFAKLVLDNPAYFRSSRIFTEYFRYNPNLRDQTDSDRMLSFLKSKEPVALSTELLGVFLGFGIHNSRMWQLNDGLRLTNHIYQKASKSVTILGWTEMN
jgi:hypothetical protein